MKRSTVFLAALAGFALGAISLVVSSGPSAAQQAGEVLRLNLFENADDSGILPSRLPTLAGAARNAGPSRGECPRGTITAWAPKGDPLYQTALAQARRDTVRDALARMGVDISQFYFDFKVADTETIAHDTVLTFGAPRDETPPKLHTSSRPEKGSKVQPRQQIVVTMTARDDTNRWQTGIRNIQLFADSDGGRIVAQQAYPPALPTCEGQPPPRTLTATYEVPADPPPIVRLRAVTRDHTGSKGHEDFDVAEFPTGDFYGTFTQIGSPASPTQSRASADIVLNHDGKGNLTGTMVGQYELLAGTVGTCSLRTIQPGRFRVSLVGSYTEGRSLKVSVEDVDDTKLRHQSRCQGVTLPVVEMDFKTLIWGIQAFLGTPSPLGEGEVLTDGTTRQYKTVAEGSGTTYAVTLRRARN